MTRLSINLSLSRIKTVGAIIRSTPFFLTATSSTKYAARKIRLHSIINYFTIMLCIWCYAFCSGTGVTKLTIYYYIPDPINIYMNYKHVCVILVYIQLMQVTYMHISYICTYLHRLVFIKSNQNEWGSCQRNDEKSEEK